MPNLEEFIKARIDEMEARVNTEPAFVEDVNSVRSPGWGNRGQCPICDRYMFDGTESVTADAWWEHLEDYHDRQQVLRTVRAYRRILGRAWIDDSYMDLEALATIWSDHTDFDPQWQFRDEVI